MNKELDELNSLGMEQREAEYHQASLFDYMGQTGAGVSSEKSKPKTYMDLLKEKIAQTEAQGKYHFLNPKKERIIPHEYVVYTLLRGKAASRGYTKFIRIYPVQKKEPGG